MGLLPVSSGFLDFGEREIEIDPSELVSSGEDPLLTAGVVRLVGVGSVLVGFFRWVEFLDGFRQP